MYYRVCVLVCLTKMQSRRLRGCIPSFLHDCTYKPLRRRQTWIHVKSSQCAKHMMKAFDSTQETSECPVTGQSLQRCVDLDRAFMCTKRFSILTSTFTNITLIKWTVSIVLLCHIASQYMMSLNTRGLMTGYWCIAALLSKLWARRQCERYNPLASLLQNKIWTLHCVENGEQE